MSHSSFCDYTGHSWVCAGRALRPLAGDRQPSACLCLKHRSMEEGIIADARSNYWLVLTP